MPYDFGDLCRDVDPYVDEVVNAVSRAFRTAFDAAVEAYMLSEFGIAIDMDNVRQHFRDRGVPEDEIDGVVDDFMAHEYGVYYDEDGNIVREGEPGAVGGNVPAPGTSLKVDSNLLILGIAAVALIFMLK